MQARKSPGNPGFTRPWNRRRGSIACRDRCGPSNSYARSVRTVEFVELVNLLSLPNERCHAALGNLSEMLAIPARVERAEDLFSLAPKGSFVSVQPCQGAAIQFRQTQKTVREVVH